MHNNLIPGIISRGRDHLRGHACLPLRQDCARAGALFDGKVDTEEELKKLMGDVKT
jgi:hypothetical protein